MELGSMAVLLDPTSAGIGAWQPGLHKGFGIVGEVGAPSWFELHARNYAAAVKFYEDVFHWETHAVSDVPELRYTTLGESETAAAGIMDASGFLPEGMPSMWAVYFGTEDADASLARAVELGGTVVMTAEDTPYGRLASATDSTGALFRLIQPNA
jgi:predicted enzyme related to lactoylglutathione lyase